MNNEKIARQLEALAAQIRAGANRDPIPVTAFQATVGVYALVDPQSNRVMYVGQSLDIEYRFRQHLTLKANDPNKRKCEWIRQLQSKGLVPTLVILERCKGKDLNEIERKKIRHFQSIGQCELNQQSYGLGNGAVMKSSGTGRDDWFQVARKYMAAARLLEEIAKDTDQLCGGAMRSRVMGIRGKVLGISLAFKEAMKSKFGNDRELVRAINAKDSHHGNGATDSINL